MFKKKKKKESQPSMHCKAGKKLPGMPDYGYLAETVSRGANIIASSSSQETGHALSKLTDSPMNYPM